jgi:hypothetical protein
MERGNGYKGSGTKFFLNLKNENMKTAIKPPKNKKPEQITPEKTPDAPAAAERTSGRGPDEASGPETPSREEVISTWRKPVTNTDEQEKITNANDDIPVPDK